METLDTLVLAALKEESRAVHGDTPKGLTYSSYFRELKPSLSQIRAACNRLVEKGLALKVEVPKTRGFQTSLKPGFRALEIDRCACVFQKREGSTIQRIALFSTHRCSYKGKITLTNSRGETRKFCKRHGQMALDGYLDADGQAMDPSTRADCQKHDIKPFHVGEWTAA